MDERCEYDSEMGRLLAEYAADQCIFLSDLEGQVSGWNRGAERLFGYAESEILGRPAECLSTSEDVQSGAYGDEVRRALAGDRTESERWHRRKDGSRFWSSVVTIGLSTSDGLPRGVARIVRDRTEGWQQERFRGLMEQAPFSIQVLSTDGRTLQVNRAWEELWGATLDRLAGYNMLEDPQLAAKGILALLRQAFAGRAVTLPSIEYDPNETIPDDSLAEDRRRWVSAVAYPIKDHSQSVREVILVHQDITAQKRAEDALRQSEERFRSIVSHSIAGVAEVDLTGRFLFVNEQYCKIVGRSADELRSLRMQDISHPDDLAFNMPLFEKMVRDGTPYVIEKRYLLPDGSQVWVNNSVSGLRGPDGQVRSIAAVCVDVTARRRAEEAHREGESRLRKVTDNLPNGALYRVEHDRVTGATRFTYLSAGVEQIFGVSAEAAVADSSLLYGSIHEEDRQRVLAAEADSLRTLGQFDVEFRVFHRSGQMRWLHCRAAPHDSAGSSVVWEGVMLDVTDRKLAEQSLRDADRRKDEFLAMLGHELRNPLAPIRTGLELLALEQDSEVIRLMTRQVDHLVRLVDDLLDVSRIMRGKIGLRREPVELAHIVAQAIEISRPVIDGQHHQLTRSLPAEPVWIDGDPVRLAQVFGNLLNNAAKYTPPHGQIWISAETDDDAVLVRIRDNGMGIEPQLLPHIFDLFTQGDRAIDRSQGGLGIGLTVVRSLVEMHGGAVHVHSEGAGRGSEFVVRLPLLASQQRMQGISEASRIQRGYRILVVDDNDAAATVLKLLLTRLGPNEVMVAHDGPTALAAIDQQHPEVVLLDLGLPGLSGLEVARRLRANPDYANMLLVALTGYGTPDDRQSVEEVGFDTHLIKPADMAALQRLFDHPKLASTKKR